MVVASDPSFYGVSASLVAGTARPLAGLLSLLPGTVEYRRDMLALRQQYPGMPRSMTSVVALLIAALGVIAFPAVIFRSWAHGRPA